ncbi:MAG: hypothetical protein ABSA94_10160 [Acidobacteriaceae bacterium]|jgi:hypothetical protein
MALDEGFRRMRTVGKAILAAGLLLDLFLIIGLIVAAFAAPPSPFFAIGAFGIPLTVTGATVLLGAWIGEGFARPRQPPHR